MSLKKRLFIGNLPPDTTDTDIRKKFKKYGMVLSVEIKQKLDTSSFAFLNLETDKEKLESCFKALSEKKWNNNIIKLEIAKESFLNRLQKEREENKILQLQKNLYDLNTHRKSDKELHEVSDIKKTKKKKKVFNRSENFKDRNKESTTESSDEDTKYNGRLKMFQGTKNYLSNGIITKDLKLSSSKNSLQPTSITSSLVERLELFNDTWKDPEQIYYKKTDTSPSNSHLLTEENHMKSIEEKRTVQEQKQAIKSTLSGDLLESQTRYGNHKRFKLDERFHESHEDISKNNEGSSNFDTKKKTHLSILKNASDHENTAFNEKLNKSGCVSMFRFDPTKPDHARFEKKQDDDTKCKEKSLKNKDHKGNTEIKKTVSNEKFYKVTDSFKEALKSREGKAEFSLRKMFGASIEDDKKVEDSGKSYNISGDKSAEYISKRDPFKYDSSYLEEDESSKTFLRESAESLEHNKEGVLKYESTNQGHSQESFFFKLNDIRLQEGLYFLKHNSKYESQDFTMHRRELKRIIRSKVSRVKNVARKSEVWKKKTRKTTKFKKRN